MAYLPDLSSKNREKLIHSNACFLIVPAGLCAVAVLIHWMMAFG